MTKWYGLLVDNTLIEIIEISNLHFPQSCDFEKFDTEVIEQGKDWRIIQIDKGAFISFI